MYRHMNRYAYLVYTHICIIIRMRNKNAFFSYGVFLQQTNMIYSSLPLTFPFK